jgi:deoxyadenosine/deoxycytidine kinase
MFTLFKMWTLCNSLVLDINVEHCEMGKIMMKYVSVYLRTQPETIAERIKKRGRKEERPIPIVSTGVLSHVHRMEYFSSFD